MNLKALRRGVAALCLTLPLAACAGVGSGDESGTFTIGVASGQSGYLSPFDTAILAGVKERVAQLNKDGGLAGKYRIEVKVKDTRSDIGDQATATQAMVDDGADALVLACDSDPSIAGGQIAQRAKVIAFGCPANPEKIGSYLFQMFVPERMNPTVLAQYAKREKLNKAFLLGSSDTAYTQNGVAYFKSAFTGIGGTIAGEGNFALDQQDFATLVAKIKSSGADVIMTTLYEPGIVSFLKQLRGAGVDIPVLGDSLETPGVFALADSARGELAYTAIADTNPGTPVGDYLDTIRKTYGADQANVYALLGNDIVCALDAAVRKTGSTDPESLAPAVAKLTNVEGVGGSFSYNWPGAGQTQLRQIFVKQPEGEGRSKILWSTTPDPAALPKVIE
ncbi:ABC transporter substrate-binding protein [Micromonospora sp. NPDC048830]|uniref:ABC transporter substrate-binding protein n=1 Tax=Micromonospora sp. NPDC048830 TaxID=3364257 RepID=UPI00371463D7